VRDNSRSRRVESKGKKSGKVRKFVSGGDGGEEEESQTATCNGIRDLYGGGRRVSTIESEVLILIFKKHKTPRRTPY